MFDFIERGYDSFYELYDGKSLVMDNLRKIYNEDISINEKINKGFDYVKEILDIYLDLWYFSTVTFTTLGFGDLTVTTFFGKLLVCIEAFSGVTIGSTWASLVIKRMIR